MEKNLSNVSAAKKGQRLCIYIGESDLWRGKPLYLALIEVLRAQGVAGATVFRGIAGYGAHSAIHTTRLEVLSMDLPILVEVVDTPEAIAGVLEVISPMVREGLMTLDEVEILKYTHRFMNPLPADKLVAEVMTAEVFTLRVEASVQEAWEKMLKSRIKVLPVVDKGGFVVGMVTDEDLLERAGVQQRLSIALRMDGHLVEQELKSLGKSTLSVKDVMTHPVITVKASDSLGLATARMVKTGLKRLPVVDKEGKLVGILSRLDILRQVASAPGAIPAAAVPTGSVRQVGEVMSTQLPSVNEADDLPAMVEKFARTESHRLIVVDGQGKAVGLISDSDLVARIAPERQHGILSALYQRRLIPAGEETARVLMSPGVLTCTAELTLIAALQRMLAASRKWMVVVDAEQRPIGLVDRRRMLEALMVNDVR